MLNYTNIIQYVVYIFELSVDLTKQYITVYQKLYYLKIFYLNRFCKNKKIRKDAESQIINSNLYYCNTQIKIYLI